MTRAGRAAVTVTVLCLLVAVRVVALDADPPRWLSWSGGLYTDEGFYTLDARHEALFGTETRGNFHDRLLSPGLSVVQEGVFRLLGVGRVQARLVSVAFGLLTVIVFYGGIRAACGRCAASWAALLLGLAPPFVFYNRLALQESPAVFWLVLAFALWAQGRQKSNRGLLALAGAAAGMAILFKTLAVLFVPALLWGAARPGARGRTFWFGFVGAAALYGIFWYAPHHTELARMAAYYRAHQFVPHRITSVGLNVRRGIIGDGMGLARGVVLYWLVLLPVPCLLAARRIKTVEVAERVLWGWLALGLAFCLLASYAPDRYYVLFLPPLMGLAGCALARLTRPHQALVAGVFLLTSGIWFVSAWMSRAWTERNAGQVLARLLPPGSVVAGDIAPALCLDTSFAAIPVQPGLSNDVHPVERVGASAIAMTRAPVYEGWWGAHYPQILQPSRRLGTLPFGAKTVIEIYRVMP